MEALWKVSFPYWQFVLRGVVVYLGILLLLRLGGKRQVGQLGVGEFVAILLISNAVQNSMNGGDNSVTGGIVLAVVIILLSVGISYATYRSPKFEGFLQGSPATLVKNGVVIRRNLNKELLSEPELRMLLRRQGIHSYSEIDEAIMESDGYISVTRVSDPRPSPGVDADRSAEQSHAIEDHY